MRLVVLIPVFNEPDALRHSLASLASDPEPFDILIVDDGSREPLTCPLRMGMHAVTVLRHHANRGVAAALNTGLEWILARGYDAVARLDAGDLNEPSRIRLQRAYLAAHPDTAIVGSWTRHVDASMHPLYVTRYPETWAGIRRCFHYRSAFCHPACMIRTFVFERVGRYDAGYPLGEDYDLFWRTAQEHPCANLPIVLVTRVEHPGSLTRVKRLAASRTRLVLQMRHFHWARPECWLGLLRSLCLLPLPGTAALRLKQLAGRVG